MTESETTTIAVHRSTRDRLNAQRRLLDGGRAETADEVVTRLLDELDTLRNGVKGRGGGRGRAEGAAAP